jgi:ATP-dependent Zn protease
VALGVTMTLPTEDKYCARRTSCSRRSRGDGGRAAEDLVFDHLDRRVQRPREATKIARNGLQLRLSESSGP